MEKSVSIIIPTYNREKYLSKAIDSVLAQTYPYYELIVVDDGSDDNTAELINKYGSDIVYIRQENKGPAAARNTGVQAARFNLLAFLDSDDFFTENKLEVQVRAMQENQACIRHKKGDGDIFIQSLELCAVGMSTVMLHRKIFDRFGLFDEDYPCCEDYEFWLRVSARQKFLLIDQALTIKDGGRDDQLSRIYRVGMDKFRIRAIMKLLQSVALTEEQRESAMAELQRKCHIYGRGCIKHGRKNEGWYYLGLPETARSGQIL